MSSENHGRLRNGNPRGDPHAAPRCSAHTRAGGPCRQPAMPNGRCRLHGGHSTGPRTESGRAALAAARTKHGQYGAESRSFLAAIDALLRDAPIRPAGRRGPPRRAWIPGRYNGPYWVPGHWA
jgi:hypothetical protein